MHALQASARIAAVSVASPLSLAVSLIFQFGVRFRFNTAPVLSYPATRFQCLDVSRGSQTFILFPVLLSIYNRQLISIRAQLTRFSHNNPTEYIATLLLITWLTAESKSRIKQQREGTDRNSDHPVPHQPRNLDL
jgi:hypothetical protein